MRANVAFPLKQENSFTLCIEHHPIHSNLMSKHLNLNLLQFENKEHISFERHQSYLCHNLKCLFKPYIQLVAPNVRNVKQ